MNATSQPTPSANTEIPLIRAAKEKLLNQMYFTRHWIELIRLIGYQTVPLELAQDSIMPLAEEFGKERVAAACEILVEISMQGQDAFARLKPHVRQMAFQILGPEPSADAAPSTIASTPAIASSHPEKVVPQPSDTKKTKKPGNPPVQPSNAANVAPASRDGCDAIFQQYRKAKEKHPDMLLLFRMGDFYELFGQDADIAHKLLGLTLTTRDRTLTMAGFPHHQLEAYLHKLLQAGQRVAVCEPLDESLARGPIRREVTRVVTRGTMVEEEVSEAGKEHKPEEDSQKGDGRSVRQSRHLVLKQCEAWLNKGGLAFVAVGDVRRTTPAIEPYVGALDFIVLRGDEKLLVTVRPHLQTKHLNAIRELQDLYGPEYRPVRIWPCEGPEGWSWHDYPVNLSATKLAISTEGKPREKRSRVIKSRDSC